jgi:hypothetical protein
MSVSKLYAVRAIVLIVLCAVGASLHSEAQTNPQYTKTTGQSNWAAYQVYYSAAPFDSTLPRKFQIIYPSKLFPGAPAGYIKNIYFMGGFGLNPMPGIGAIYDVRIKMGYTKRDSFKRMNWAYHYVRDTFITGLTTVFSADSVEEDLKNHTRVWLKFPLQGNGFYYNASSEQNLVVELSFGNTPWVRNYFILIDSMGGDGNRLMAGYRDSIAVQIHRATEKTIGTGGSIDFGFDIGPSNGISPASKEVGLFISPYPSHGIFRLNGDGLLPSNNKVCFTVRNSAGQQVYQRQTSVTSIGNLTEEIDLSKAPKGLYYLELTSGEMYFTRRLVVE